MTGAAILARGLREDQKHARLVVNILKGFRGDFDRVLELRSDIFPNTLRCHSPLG